jgi:uncharacterized membrane protein
MKFKTLSSKRLLVYTGFILFVSGGFMGYLYWGIEPQESIGGFFCGTGLSLLLFYIIKKNK